MSNQSLEERIAAKPGRKVTTEYINSRIDYETYTIIPETTVTVCHIQLDNGFSVRGESACVDPDNFDVNIGQELAHEDAYNKLWPLFGFLLAEEIYQSK